MLTLLEPFSNGQMKYTCMSADEKPMDARNGDVLIEIDTGKIYFFSEDDNDWLEQPVGSGSSGGGGGSE